MARIIKSRGVSTEDVLSPLYKEGLYEIRQVSTDKGFLRIITYDNKVILLGWLGRIGEVYLETYTPYNGGMVYIPKNVSGKISVKRVLSLWGAPYGSKYLITFGDLSKAELKTILPNSIIKAIYKNAPDIKEKGSDVYCQKLMKY